MRNSRKQSTLGRYLFDAAAEVASLPKAKQRKLVEAGKVQQAAKKMREGKATSKAKTKKVNGSDDAQDPVPVTTHQVVPPSEAPKVPANLEVSPKPVEVPEPESERRAQFDDPLLVREAHDALDEMILAGQRAGKGDRVASILKGLLKSCAKLKAGFGEEAVS